MYIFIVRIYSSTYIIVFIMHLQWKRYFDVKSQILI